MLRNTAIDECGNLSKAHKTSQLLLLIGMQLDATQQQRRLADKTEQHHNWIRQAG